MQVLIGVDGSSESFAAAEFAANLLSPARDQVTFFYAPPDVRIPSATDPKLVERARAAVAEAVFEEARARLPEPLRGSSQTIVGTQKPARGILLAADDISAGLIVVGASGAGTVGSWLLGTVSMEVLDHAKIPVLTVRPSQPSGAASKRVLIAYDGSQGSQLAVSSLQRLTWPAGSHACVLGVVEPLLSGHVPEWLAKKVRSPEIEEMTRVWANEYDAEKQSRSEEISAVCRNLPAPLTGAEPLIVEGDAVESILATAGDRKIDLLVLGARGQGNWERLLLGSTVDRIVSHAPCSVLVVRERERP